ncbi:MAG TPA: TIGR02646 family protein [Chitinophagales bacterium]|nr:TIGR02646 family protein [Chitinophagales bacterium]
MKGIIKNQPPPNFIRWVADYEKLTGTTSYSWNRLRDINDEDTRTRIINEFGYCFEKKNLRLALLQEQGFICCYCCKPLTNDKSVIIEHYNPRSKSPENMFDYNNLFVCCSGIEVGDDGEQIKPKHCGDAKDDILEIIEENGIFVRIIDPLEKESEEVFTCEKSFVYDFSGNIFESNGNQNAAFTIKQLRLNHQQLIKSRALVLEEAFPGITETGIIDLDRDEAKLYLDHYMQLHRDDEDSELKFEPFCNIVIFFLKFILHHAKTIS